MLSYSKQESVKLTGHEVSHLSANTLLSEKLTMEARANGTCRERYIYAAYSASHGKLRFASKGNVKVQMALREFWNYSTGARASAVGAKRRFACARLNYNGEPIPVTS